MRREALVFLVDVEFGMGRGFSISDQAFFERKNGPVPYAAMTERQNEVIIAVFQSDRPSRGEISRSTRSIDLFLPPIYHVSRGVTI